MHMCKMHALEPVHIMSNLVGKAAYCDIPAACD